MRRNGTVFRDEDAIDRGPLEIWQVMQDCVRNDCNRDGVLPGGLRVRRRAPELHRRLEAAPAGDDPLAVTDRVSLFAIAVKEENASGGPIVTAPDERCRRDRPCGTALLPPVRARRRRRRPLPADRGSDRSIIKQNASISGAEVGCRGEVGSAGLNAVLGGTPEQVENAAEIGLEHHLGLTCDPVGGLVQIPCTERNAVGATKAIHAAIVAISPPGESLLRYGR